MKTQKSVAIVRAMLNINDEIDKITAFLEEDEEFSDTLPELAFINYAFFNWEDKVFQKIKEGEKS